jgi:PAS domain S-box-containing protein
MPEHESRLRSRLARLASSSIDTTAHMTLDKRGWVRAQQIAAFKQLLPGVAAANCANAVLLLLIFWSTPHRAFLLVWTVIISIAASLPLLRSLVRHRAEPAVRSERAIWKVTRDSSILAVGWVVMLIYVFPHANVGQQMTIAVVAVGMMCGGAFMLSTVEPAALVFSGLICLGGAAVLCIDGKPIFKILALLLLSYFAVLAYGIRWISRLFVRQLLSRAEAKEKSELIGLLLHDFEQASSDWLWHLDEQGQIVEPSPRFASAFGMAKGDLEGCNLVDILRSGPEREALRAAIEARRPFRNLQVPIDTVAGERWLSFAGQSSPGLGGAGRARGVASDVTAEQHAQRRLEEALRDYETLAGSLADVIYRTDIEGVCNYVSPGCEAMLGYHPEELIGRTRSHIDHAENDVTSLMGALGRMGADPSRSEILISRVRHKDGRWLWVQSNLKLTVERGAVVGCIDIMRDVTEQVAAEAALTAAKLEAESANRAKAEFLANVSHEIRTPMNGILSALHLLGREPISAEGRELMRHADDSGRMLSQLLNDVLDFSKIEAGQLDLSPEPMNVGEALEGVIALLAGQARAKGVALTCEIAGGDQCIEADPVRVRQAIFNLIGNAVKFTARGHVTARLVIEPAAPERLRVCLEITDTGIGMSPEAQSHLFERFSQAEGDTARRFGGTGLGLSITQALVGMMGGAITFSSVEGKGSTFKMAFEAPAAQAVIARTVEEGLLEGLSILLVEDNPTNRVMARTILLRLGARVEEAEDGLLGLEAARRGAHDLILMDVQMPHMDGIEATRAIRGLPSAVAQTPILGLTANVMVHQRLVYLAAGMNGVVAKPISPAALLAEIARVIGQVDEDEIRAVEAF